MNIAARAGRWSANHRKTAIWGWLAFVLVALAVGSVSGMKTIADSDGGNGESGRADKTAARAFPEDASESVLVQSSTLKASSPQFQEALGDVKNRLARTGVARDIASPHVSPDGHSALLEFNIPGDEANAEGSVARTLAAVAAADAAHPELRIEEFGDASATKALKKSFEADFKKAETLSLPIT